VDADYVHGYQQREAERLRDQAGILANLLHQDTLFPAGSRVLEVGCGVGAQTAIIARLNPQTRFVSIDRAASSLTLARASLLSAGITNVELQQADLFALPFTPESFDHVFVCFVLEHLAQPHQALALLHPMLRRGGSIIVIEGDHGSTLFHPDATEAHAVIECQMELQRRAGGDAAIGRKLHPLLRSAGFNSVEVTPRMAYADGSRPQWQEEFTRRTFTAMIEGIRESALSAALCDSHTFETGVRQLHRTAEIDGIFCYTFFKAVGTR